jgi:hypothetical protein
MFKLKVATPTQDTLNHWRQGQGAAVWNIKMLLFQNPAFAFTAFSYTHRGGSWRLCW